MRTIFALADCNNFYASCEQVFKPAWRNRPLIVLSNNDACVVARSKEAKALGIKMGEPVFKIQELIRRHNVIACSSHYTLYADMSRRVMETLAQFTPEMEVYSVDEAFLNLAGLPEPDLAAYARHIREIVRKWTGIPVSIGIASTKTLAKIANRLAKKSEKAAGTLNLVDSPYLNRALEATPVEDVWGIGPSSSELLRYKGILNARQLREADQDWLKRRLGINGVRTAKELAGISCFPLELNPPPSQSVTVSRSFASTVVALSELEESLADYIFKAGENLREQKLLARVISVFVATNRFAEEPQYQSSNSLELPVPSDDAGELIACGLELLRKIYRSGFRYKKIGVVLTALQSEGIFQTHLFDPRDRQRSKRLMQVVDFLNARWGADTIRYAACGFGCRFSTGSAKTVDI